MDWHNALSAAVAQVGEAWMSDDVDRSSIRHDTTDWTQSINTLSRQQPLKHCTPASSAVAFAYYVN